MAKRIMTLYIVISLISLTVGQLEIMPPGPVQSVPLHENLLLTCTAVGVNPEVNSDLRWFNQRNEEITYYSSRFPDNTRIYIDRPYPQVLKLYITDVRFDDEGQYRCRGIVNGLQNATVRVTVFQDITFDEAPTPQHPKNGSDALIRCRVSGQPIPTISWKFKGQSLITGGRYEILSDQGLRIFNVLKSRDDGDYICRAEVATSGKVKEEVIRVETHTMPVMTKPVGVQDGIAQQETSFICKGTSIPPPKYEFYKNNEVNPVQQTKRIHIDVDGGTINFYPLIRGDEGKYKCVAYNTVGRVEDTGELVVYVIPVINLLLNKTGEEGKSQSLTCHAEGFPPPAMTFLKVGNQQPYVIGENEGGDVILENNADGKLDMTIKNLTPEDTSNYTCIAQNRAGDHKLNGTLTVYYSPRFPTDHPSLVYLWALKTRNVTCFVQCDPEPTQEFGGWIRWFKDGVELQNNETYRIYNMKKNSNLQIHVRMEDEYWVYGKYSCRAHNSQGTNQIDMTVKAARRPESPIGVKVREESPTLLILDVEPPSDNGGVPIYGYRVQWESYIQDFLIGKPLRLENLKPDTRYIFQISARNEVGDGVDLKYAHSMKPIRAPYAIEPTSDPEGQYPYEYRIYWEEPQTGGLPIVEYEFMIRMVKVNNLGEFVGKIEDYVRALRMDRPETPMTSYLFKNLHPNSYYQVEIRARNDIGWGDPNPEFIFSTTRDPGYGSSIGGGSSGIHQVSAAAFTLSVFTILTTIQ